MRAVLMGLALVSIATSCGRQSCSSYGAPPLASHVYATPHIALLPVSNACGDPLPWHLSEELTEQIGSALANCEGLNLMDPAVGRAIAAELEHVDLFGPSLRDVRGDGRCDFLVATELIDHELVPYRGQRVQQLYSTDGEIGSILMMKLRLRVIDLRGENPRVVLQEIVNSNHLVRKRDQAIDYTVSGWGHPDFEESPIGIAHGHLAEDTAGRVVQYVSVVR